MNGTAYNHTTQTLNIPYTLIQPVIPGKQLTYETRRQQAIRHYEDFILDIMKVMELQCIAHCADEDYQLITIQGGDDMLIHINQARLLGNDYCIKRKTKHNLSRPELTEYNKLHCYQMEIKHGLQT